MLATGKLAWRYMNKILLNWHEKNLHTGRQVSAEAKSVQPQNASAVSADSAAEDKSIGQ